MRYTCHYYDARTGARLPTCEFNRDLPDQAPPGAVIKAVPARGGEPFWLDEQGVLSGPPVWGQKRVLTLVVELDADRHRDLTARAQAAGLSPAELLKKALHDGAGVPGEAVTVTSPEP